MSYLTIESFIEAGRKSLKDKNYWSALSVALTLPSMCSRLAFENNPDKYKDFKWIDKNDHNKGKEYTKWKDKECYEDFCKLAMRCDTTNSEGCLVKDVPDIYLTQILGDRFFEILYLLRCDIIHAGSIDLYADNKGLYLRLGDTSAVELSQYRIVPIDSLCDTIFNHIERWCHNFGKQNLKYTYVFDTERNSDDRLLLNRLCNDERANYLKKHFEKLHKGE